MTSTCPAGHQSEADDYCDVCGTPLGAAAPAGPGAGVPPGPGVGAPPGPGSLLDLGSAAGGAGPGAGRPGSGVACPHCNAANMPGALFCESCGYDFTTGQLPRTDPPPLAPPEGLTPAAGLHSAAGTPLPPPLPPSSLPPSSLPPSSLPADPPSAVPPGQQGPVEWVAEVWIDPDWHAAQEVSEPCPSPGMPDVVALRGTSQLIGRRSASRNIHPQIDCGADTGVSRRHAQLTTDGRRWWVEDLQSSNGTYLGTSGAAVPDVPVPPGQRAELPDDARVYVGAWTRIVVRVATAEERAAG